MVNIMKKNLLLFIFLLLLIIPISIKAEVEDTTGNDYYITSYDINIKVNENNTFNIKEKIDASFEVPKHGIIRKIPVRNQVKRIDGTSSNKRAQVFDIKVNDKYSVSLYSDYKNIKIGDPGKVLIGNKSYEISYLYNIGKDPLKDKDEFYFNIIGNDWDTTISNVTFRIEMPKAFDKEKIGFSSGSYESIDSSNITYNVDGNIISGTYNGTLNRNEAITIRMELPEGYFVGAKYIKSIWFYIGIIVPIICLILSYFIWKKFGKDEEVVDTVEFYPPNKLNSLDVAYYYKNSVNSKDVVSLLIYLANKGYIKITEIEEKGLLRKKKSFKITKLKEYDGNNYCERLFIKGLFKNIKSNSDEPQEVTLKELKDKFYKTINKIVNHANGEGKRKTIIEKAPTKQSIFVAGLFIISAFITILPLILEVGMPELLIEYVFFVFGTICIAIYLRKNHTPGDIFGGIFFWLCFCSFGLFVPIAMIVALLEFDYLIALALGLINSFVIIVCFINLPKRTRFGTIILGRVRGFKKYLETVEKDRLESLVEQNPTYFYDILPYAYVLGVSNKWIKKFESLSIVEPDWYYSTTPFSLNTFSTSINRTLDSAYNVMTYDSTPSSGGGGSGFSGGGSSGGGFSGGGSGGGGGSSW